jgi:hypothetical protein
MFMNNESRLAVYYTACNQASRFDCRVAKWFFTNVQCGRFPEHWSYPVPTRDTEAYDCWVRAVHWPIVTVFEVTCPYPGDRCPADWHMDHPWFERQKTRDCPLDFLSVHKMEYRRKRLFSSL